MLVWTLDTGRDEDARQAAGLALALRPQKHRIVSLHIPWLLRILPKSWASRLLRHRHISAPWPDIAIGCGKTTEIVLRAIQRRSKHGSYTVIIRANRTSSRPFDVLVTNTDAKGKEIVRITGMLNPLLPSALQRLRNQKSVWDDLPKPHTMVFLDRALPKKKVLSLKTRLVDLIGKEGGSLIIKVSSKRNRRTHHFSLPSTISFLIDGGNALSGDSMLAKADRILVANGRLSTLSKAIMTGKPVYVLEDDRWSPLFCKAVKTFQRLKQVRLFKRHMTSYAYTPLMETQKAARHVRNLCTLRQRD